MVWWSGDTVAYYYTHQVEVAFNQSSASPGDSISVATVTSPGSVVLLSVIDKSLTLLADACKSLESDNVSCIVGNTGDRKTEIDRLIDK